MLKKTRNPEFVVLRQYAFIFIIYVLATWLTDAFYMGDTWIYVGDIATNGLRANFWEFGHAIWRPLGWLVAKALYPLNRHWLGEDWRANVTASLIAINWFAGFIAASLVYALASLFCQRRWVAYLVTIAFLFSNSILNYTQTGHSYVPGICLVLAGLYLLVKGGERGDSSRKTSGLAGSALAGGICMWLPLLFSVPAILLCPLILFGFDKNRLRLVLQTAVSVALVVGFVYVAMMINLGIHDAATFKTWIGSSGHGILPDTPIRAVQRMIFGMSRNWINMGNDGRLFKRYLVNDPFNPVSLADLVRFSVWKLVLFYVFLSAIVANLLLSKPGRRTLVLLLLNAIPVVGFALFLFESGSIDRYLPLFPMLLLSFAVSLGADSARSWNRVIALAFVGVVVFANVSAMSAVTLRNEQEKVALRIRDLEPMLNSESRVITVNEQDEVYAFNQNFPFNRINRSGRLAADSLVDPGSTQISRWRQIFASKTLAKWDKGGDVWITKRVLSSRPKADWNWVEGDDPNISWTDIYKFFGNLEFGQAVGKEDGFVLVLPSDHNRQFLNKVAF
jgi:hypothetical protein